MPQNLSGLAGVVDAPRQPDIGVQVMQLAQMAEQLKASKQQEALSKLTTMSTLMDKGIFPDPKAFEATAKQAGVQLMNLEDYNKIQPGQPMGSPPTPNKVAQMGGDTEGNKAGAAAGNPPSKAAANMNPATGETPPVVGTEAGTLPKLESAAAKGQIGGPGAPAPGGQPQAPPLSPLQQTFQRMREQQALTAQADAIKVQKQMDIDRLATEIYQDSQSGRPIDPAKAITWARLNGLPYGVDQQTFDTMNPQQKQTYISIHQLGGMTDSERGALRTQMLKELDATWSQHFASPQDAAKVASSLANDWTWPKDVVLKRDPRETQQDAERMVQFLPYLGLEGANTAVNNLRAGKDMLYGMEPNTKSLLETRMSIDNRRVGIEEQNMKIAAGQLGLNAEDLKIRIADSKTAAAKIEIAAREADNKEFMSRYDAMTAANKAGHPWPADLQDQMTKELGERAGLTVQERTGWDTLMKVFTFGFAGGSGRYKYGPPAGATPEQMGVGATSPPKVPAGPMQPGAQIEEGAPILQSPQAPPQRTKGEGFQVGNIEESRKRLSAAQERRRKEREMSFPAGPFKSVKPRS